MKTSLTNTAITSAICLLGILMPPPLLAGTFLAFGPQTYQRETGEPVTINDIFSVLNPNTTYTLQIFNGGIEDGEFEKVSSSVISLNGVQVVGTDEFNQNITSVEKPITVNMTNELSVMVRGKPGGAITVQIIGVDDDPPTITAGVDPLPNEAGWHNRDVTVTFSCSDSTSGITTCPSPILVQTEGADQLVSGTAVDLAGNLATVSVSLNIDTVPPRIEIDSPQNGLNTNSPLVTVMGLINDDGMDFTRANTVDTRQLQVNVKSQLYETSAQVENGQFIAEDFILDAGINTITVTGKDLAGNIAIIEDLFIEYVPSLPAPESTSLRILTYNTAFLSMTVDVTGFPDVTIEPNDGNFSDLDYLKRAVKIAQGILRGDQDVVVLNEVFSDDARNYLEILLRGTYQHYITKLAGPPPGGIYNLAYLVDALLTGPKPSGSFDVPDIPGIGDMSVYPGDSGLMIFSRYRFLPLTGGNPPNDTNVFAGWNDGGMLLPGYFAFDVFDQCADFDCYASKGVGLVKIETPVQPSYVAFTHLQAYDEYRAQRETQYQQIKQTLIDTIPAGDLVNLPVYVVGDLNTAGANKADTSPSEWLDIFHPYTSGDKFFACGNGPCFFQSGNGDLLTDSWGFETSENDLGASEQFGDRLDYILHGNVDSAATDTRLCMQHAMIAWDLAEGGTDWYSDHPPVRADFNGKAKWCSANDDAPDPYGPELIQFVNTNCDDDPITPDPPCVQDITYSNKITHRGSFQWFKIEEPGSYSIKIWAATPGEDVTFDVYNDTDLSRPISPFDEEEHPRWGLGFSMLKPPYYIRVYAVDSQGNPDRTANDRFYSIRFHQHLCQDPEDGCFLPPGAVEHPAKWPEITGTSQVLHLWFKFKTAGVRDGHLDNDPALYPVVELQQEAATLPDLNCLKEMTLEEYDKNIPPNFIQEIPFDHVNIDPGNNDWNDDGFEDEIYVAPDLDTDTYDELKTYYAVMHRENKSACIVPITTWARYMTTLSYFIPGYTRCHRQADDSGIGEDDEMGFYVYFDSPEPNPSSAVRCDLGGCYKQNFDEEEGEAYLTNVSSLQGYFARWVHLDLHEEEDGGPDILLITNDEWFGWPGADGNISMLGSWSTIQNGSIVYGDGPSPDHSDYWYTVKYVLCHQKDDCRF